MTDRKKVGQMSREEWEAQFGSLGKARPARQAAPSRYVESEIPDRSVQRAGDKQITREQFEAMKGRPTQADIDVVNTAGVEKIYQDTYGQVYINAVRQGYNEQVADRLAHEAGQNAQRGYVSTEPVGPQSEVMAAVVDDALKQQALEQIVQASAQGDINLGGIRQAPAAAKAPYTEPMAVVTDAMEAAPVPVAPSGERMAMRYPAGILAALLGGGGLWELVDEDPRSVATV